MNLSKLAFIFLLTTCLCINIRRLLQARKLEEVCNAKVTNWFVEIDTDSVFTATPPSDQLKKYCPEMVSSCCTVDQVKPHFDQFHSNYMALRDYFLIEHNILKALEDIGIKPKERAIAPVKVDSGMNEESEEKLEEEPKKETEEELLSYFLHNLQKFRDNNHSFNYTATSYYSGLICEVCQPIDPLTYLEINGEDITHLLIDFETYFEYAKVFRQLLKVSKDYSLIYNEFKKILELNGKFIHIDMPDPNQMQKFDEEIGECLQIKKVENLINNRDCLEILEGSDIIFGINNFDNFKELTEMMKDFMVTKYKKYISHDGPCPLQSEFKFGQYTKSGLKTLKEAKIKFAENKGLRIFSPKYEEKLWYLTASRVGIISLIFALLVFIRM